MKRISLLTTIILFTFLLVSCKTNNKLIYEDADQSDMNIYFKHKEGRIGDVMPFYDDGIWNVFYLHDSPPRPGFHPWYRSSTTDFVRFTDHGEVLGVVHETDNAELALGTGSVIRVDDTYHAFYTSHNRNLNPIEQIMHATSNDGMKTWNKIPSDTINPLEFGFEGNNFRDPDVVYIPEKDVYYMLFTTRHQGKGAIGYLESEDLITWTKKDDGIFFLNNSINGTTRADSNLECPTLIYVNGYWYLTFSDQWPNRVTHYLYTDSLDKDFIKPTNNIFDGAGLYAGKIGTDGSRIMLMGWVSSDFNRDTEFAWAGNFVAHELKQYPNGQLYVSLINEIDNNISRLNELKLEENNTKGSNFETVNFDNTKNYQYATFNELKGINKITGTLELKDISDSFGIYFDYYDNSSSFYYSFDTNNNSYSFNLGTFTSDISDKIYTTNSFYKTSNKINFTLLFEEGSDADGSIVTLYIEGQMALTGRMFRIKETNFGFYSINNDLSITNLRLYR